MITYAERACFRDPHLCLLPRVEEYVKRVSNTWGNELRCHELARAVLRVALSDGTRGWVVRYARELAVIDGKCGSIEHSWLGFADGVILDPYAPGRLPAVQLVDPLAGMYCPGETRHDVRGDFVDRLVREMRGDA